MGKHCCSLCHSPLHEDIKIVLRQGENFDIETHPCSKCNLLHDEDGRAIAIQGDLLFLETDWQTLINSILVGEEEDGGEDIVKKYLM